MTLSLRARLLWGIIVGTAVLLTLFSVAVYTLMRRSLIEHFDTSLLNTAQMLSAIIEEEGFEGNTGDIDEHSERTLDIEFDVRMTPEFNHINGGGYYQIWNATGETLLRSPSLGNQDLVFTYRTDIPVFCEMMIPDKKWGRGVYYSFLPRIDSELPQETVQEDRLTLVVARRADELYEHLRFLMWLLAGASVGVVILSTGIAAIVTRISLAPIHTLAAGINEIREDNLAIQFCPDNYPAELRPVCRCLNDAFARLTESFRREKQFNANVAHELRTPLAGMQSIIEVSLSRPRESTEYKAAFEDCLHVVHAMNKMIDTLLMLSRLNAGQISMQIESVDLTTLIADIWKLFADTAHDKNITFDNSIEPDTICQSDKEHLGMILSNVMHNAVEYTPVDGQIWTAAEQSDGVLVVSICNTGCELTDEDASHVFDFFWRKSTSRSETGKHCGIGLSVAHKMATTLGIQLEVSVREDIYMIRLTIPM